MKFTPLEEDELENNLVIKSRNSLNGAITYLEAGYLPQLSEYVK